MKTPCYYVIGIRYNGNEALLYKTSSKVLANEVAKRKRALKRRWKAVAIPQGYTYPTAFCFKSKMQLLP